MSDLICRKTMRRCLTESMCAPYGGCGDKPQQQMGWVCPVCGQVMAPWQSTCTMFHGRVTNASGTAA